MVRIHFHSIQMDQISKSSGVFNGENRQLGWQHASKKNQGSGEMTGSGNVAAGGSHAVRDRDTVDVVTPAPKG